MSLFCTLMNEKIYPSYKDSPLHALLEAMKTAIKKLLATHLATDNGGFAKSETKSLLDDTQKILENITRIATHFDNGQEIDLRALNAIRNEKQAIKQTLSKYENKLPNNQILKNIQKSFISFIKNGLPEQPPIKAFYELMTTSFIEVVFATITNETYISSEEIQEITAISARLGAQDGGLVDSLESFAPFVNPDNISWAAKRALSTFEEIESPQEIYTRAGSLLKQLAQYQKPVIDERSESTPQSPESLAEGINARNELLISFQKKAQTLRTNITKSNGELDELDELLVTPLTQSLQEHPVDTKKMVDNALAIMVNEDVNRKGVFEDKFPFKTMLALPILEKISDDKEKVDSFSLLIGLEEKDTKILRDCLSAYKNTFTKYPAASNIETLNKSILSSLRNAQKVIASFNKRKTLLDKIQCLNEELSQTQQNIQNTENELVGLQQQLPETTLYEIEDNQNIVDLYNTIHKMQRYGETLNAKKKQPVIALAQELREILDSYVKSHKKNDHGKYVTSKEQQNTFFFAFLDKIEKSKETFAVHDNKIGALLQNMLLLLTALVAGIGVIARLAYTKRTQGSYQFFATTGRRCHLDKVERSLHSLSPP